MTSSFLAQGNGGQAVDILFDVIESLQKDNARLAYRVAASTRARYGRSSERLTAQELGQLVLALGGTEEEAAAENPTLPVLDEPHETGCAQPATPKRKKRRPNHPGRTELSPDLPRHITDIPVPNDERACIHCGTEMTCIDHIEHERVEFVPARIEVHVERREKLACKSCKQDITTAPRQKHQAYERRAGMSLLAHLVEAKCDDALPIYRQQDQLRRLGFDIPLNTLYGYWEYATTLLSPIADAIISTVLGGHIVGVDDTRLDYLDRSDPRGKQRGHLWCFVSEGPLVGFRFTETWEAEDIAPWLWAIDGYIQCDDYKGYAASVEDPDGVKHVLVPPERRLGCTMHVRRRFHRAFKGGHLAAAAPLKLIRDIYAVEAKAKEDNLSPPERLLLRQKESLPLLTLFDDWVDENSETLLPTSPLGTAVRYAKNQRPFVHRCFTDGRFEIDNGSVERQIREPAIGRKNYLFTGSVAAAERLAAAYSVVQSARGLGLPVRDYLIDVLEKVAAGWPARRLTELLPLQWGTARGIFSPDQSTHQPQ